MSALPVRPYAGLLFPAGLVVAAVVVLLPSLREDQFGASFWLLVVAFWLVAWQLTARLAA
jgi:NitT/TauT family transport system permease protein